MKSRIKIVLLLIILIFNIHIFAQGIEKAKVSYFGRVWNAGHADASIISQDGGFSYAVPGGSLWWFGDTFKGKRDEKGTPHFEEGAVSCCVAFLPESGKSVPPVLNYLKGKDGSAEQAIRFLPGETWDKHRIWPMSGIYVNGKSYVYYSLIEITGKGEWDFRGAGSGLACSQEPFKVHERIIKNGNWRFPVCPTAIVEEGNWLYLYEVEKIKGEQGVWLARVEKDKIEDPSEYQYYCGGNNFTNDKEKRAIFVKNIYGQVSVAWNEYLQKYVLVSSSDLFRPREIRFYTSGKPYELFAETKAAVTMPDTLQGKKVNFVYCSYLHPELFREKGKIMNITFSLNLKESNFDANNEMIEIELN